VALEQLNHEFVTKHHLGYASHAEKKYKYPDLHFYSQRLICMIAVKVQCIADKLKKRWRHTEQKQEQEITDDLDLIHAR